MRIKYQILLFIDVRKHQKTIIKFSQPIIMHQQPQTEAQSFPNLPFPSAPFSKTVAIKHCGPPISNIDSPFSCAKVNETAAQLNQILKPKTNDQSSFFVVERVQKKRTVETWLIDCKYMEVFYYQPREIVMVRELYLGMMERYRSKRVGLVNNKKKNMVFIGRSDCSPISIPNKTLSNKHLLLQKLPDPHRQQIPKISTFLLLHKKSQLHPHISPQMLILSKVPKYLIKIIVQYIGKLTYKDRYFLQDMLSKNGAFLIMGKQIRFNDYLGQFFYFDKKKEMGFSCVSILRNSALRKLRNGVDQALTKINVLGAPVSIYNRNFSIQDEKQSNQVMLLMLLTPSSKSLYTLYPSQTPYRLQKHSYTLHLEKCSNQHYPQPQQTLGFVSYSIEEKAWYYRDRDVGKNEKNGYRLFMKMESNTKYQIFQNSVYLGLGKEVQLAIGVVE